MGTQTLASICWLHLHGFQEYQGRRWVQPWPSSLPLAVALPLLYEPHGDALREEKDVSCLLRGLLWSFILCTLLWSHIADCSASDWWWEMAKFTLDYNGKQQPWFPGITNFVRLLYMNKMCLFCNFFGFVKLILLRCSSHNIQSTTWNVQINNFSYATVRLSPQYI